MKKQKTLLKKLKSYSLFTTALLATGAEADGQVIYTDVDPDSTLHEIANGASTYALDLNNDGIIDFTISEKRSSSYYFEVNAGSVIPHIGNSLSTDLNPLNSGFEINSGLSWIPNAHGTLAAHEWHYGSDILYFGHFIGQSEKYLALQFLIGGEEHYGWVRLSVGAYAESVTIIDYAYEAIAGKAIVAGDTGVIAICETPGGLTTNNIKATSAKLNWNAVSGAAGYKVRYKVAGTSVWTKKTVTGTSKTINGLSSNTAYKWGVQTFCQTTPPHVKSDWSSNQDFTTPGERVSDGLAQQVSFEIYPNPAQDHAIIQFTLPQSSYIYIKVYDVSGREITTLLNEDLQSGEHSLQLKTAEFAKGVYVVKMISEGAVQNQKLVVQ